MTDDLERALRLAPPAATPLAVLPFGSDLYGTKLDFNDIDTVVVTRSGRPGQKFDGPLDVRIAPLWHLQFHAGHGSLAEAEIMFALAAGHGRILDPSWEPLLRGLRAPLPRYTSQTGRHRGSPAFREKDGIRWDIFLERAWRTGNTDPRLDEAERELFFERLGAR